MEKHNSAMENNNDDSSSQDVRHSDDDTLSLNGNDAQGVGFRSHLSSDDDSEGEWEGRADWMEDSIFSTNSSTGGGDDDVDICSGDIPKVLQKPKPKHKWSVVKEILKRERGANPCPEVFSQRYYGSLHAVQRLELMDKLDKHSGCVNAINFNPSGTRLISGSDDKQVVMWDWAIGKAVTWFNSGHSSNVFQCKFLPLTGDGHIVTCSRDGQIRMALQNSWGGYDSTHQLARHSGPCHKLTTLPHTPHVFLSAGEDALVMSIDIRTSKPEKLVYVKENCRKISLYSIHSNPLTGNEICVAGEDYYVRIYDRRKIKSDGVAPLKFAPRHFVQPYSVYVTCALFNYNGSEVIGSYNDDDIYLFDTNHSDNADFVHKYEGHRNSDTVKGVNFFGPRSEFVVSGSDCGNIYFWDKNTESIVQWMRGDEDGVINCLEPHPRIPVIATSGLDSDIKIWVPSCEHEPTMTDLRKTVTMNQRNRETRNSSNHHSFDSLMRWWHHMRNLESRHMRSSSGEERQTTALGQYQISAFEIIPHDIGFTIPLSRGSSSSHTDGSSTSSDSSSM